MCLTEKGYFRIKAGPLRDQYAHRAYADRQMMESHGRHLRNDEEVHHLCRNRKCWPPSDFHLCIMQDVLHHFIDAGTAPYRKMKK